MVVEPTKLLGIETEKNLSMSATHGKYQKENEAETMASAISGVLTQDPQIGCEQPSSASQHVHSRFQSTVN